MYVCMYIQIYRTMHDKFCMVRYFEDDKQKVGLAANPVSQVLRVFEKLLK